MPQFKSVGVLMRDPSQTAPLEFLERVFGRLGASVQLLNHHPPRERMDLIIAMGGDGTVLQALDLQLDCPVLAINYGTVGFLTAGDRSELEQLVERLIRNDYIISERIQLRCEYEGGTTNVINEVVLRSLWRMVDVDVFVNDAKIRTIRADGVIVGTPTGSTGYLLSTGAPIVMPNVQCFVLDGLNEYNFTSRALILPADAHIRLHLVSRSPEQEVYMYIDGNKVKAVAPGEELHLSRSERTSRLIFFDKNYFFHNLSSRLSWN